MSQLPLPAYPRTTLPRLWTVGQQLQVQARGQETGNHLKKTERLESEIMVTIRYILDMDKLLRNNPRKTLLEIIPNEVRAYETKEKAYGKENGHG